MDVGMVVEERVDVAMTTVCAGAIQPTRRNVVHIPAIIHLKSSNLGMG
jgi:hypothetical protein